LVVVVVVLFLALAATAGQTEFRRIAERLGTIARSFPSSLSDPNHPRKNLQPPAETRNGVVAPTPPSTLSTHQPPVSGFQPPRPNPANPPVLAAINEADQGDSFWHQGKEYFLVTGRNWAESKSEAEAKGGQLVRIDSFDLNQRLFRAFGDALWIGLKDDAMTGRWTWPDGQGPSFTNWAPGQPDGLEAGAHAGQTCAQFWKGAMGAWDNHWLEGDNFMRGGIAERLSSQPGDDRTYPLLVEIIPGEWGGSDLENIRQVALSAANQIWKNIRGHKLAKIKIRRGLDAPQMIFARGPQGENFVEINSGSNLWAQIAYQFAHEFYHVLAASPSAGIHWFGEVLGEASSMFCLRGMSKDWSVQPPYPNWKDYARSLEDYANTLLEEAQKARGSSSLSDFIAANHKALENYDREKMKPLAAAMLPVFEANPSAWEIALYGNWGIRPGETLEPFLRRWQAACPARLQPFVAQIASALGQNLP
jgi:hypothetical protein